MDWNISKPSAANPTHAEWWDTVLRNVAALRFGSVQITIHDGRVTQVESTEKTRFPSPRPEQAKPSQG